MDLFKSLCKKLTKITSTENDQRIGELEAIFFNSAYKVVHATGLGSWDRRFLYLVYSNTVKLMIMLVVCGEVWFGVTLAATLDEISASINVTVIQFITLYRYRNMINHQDLYKKLATASTSPDFDISTDSRRKLVGYWSQKNEIYLKILVLLGEFTLVAWAVCPLFDDIEYNQITNIWLPFDCRTPVRYFFSYILVAIAFIYSAHFVMATDVIMQAHLIHILCQFTVLADCFENLMRDCSAEFEGFSVTNLLKNKDFADKYIKRLGNLVRQHSLILSNTMNLRDILSGPMLGQLAASGTLICCVGYLAATTIAENIAKFLMSFLFLGYNLFVLYIICRWCEEVTIQSHKIGESVYCSGWECGVSQLRGVRSTIMFVIARANEPLVLTAGGMYQLSLKSFNTLVKTSYSALTILLRFRHE